MNKENNITLSVGDYSKQERDELMEASFEMLDVLKHSQSVLKHTSKGGRECNKKGVNNMIIAVSVLLAGIVKSVPADKAEVRSATKSKTQWKITFKKT